MIIRSSFLAILSRAFFVFWIALALSVELTTNERLSFANDPIPTLPTRPSDLEKSALNGAYAYVFFRSQSDETNSTSLNEDLKSFFSDAPDAFVIETKPFYQYGDNIIFRLAFGDGIEPDKRKELTKKLCQPDSRFIVAFEFDRSEHEYWEPRPGYKLTFIEWALFPNDGFPSYFRMRSDCVYRSIAPHSASVRNERDFKATIPLKFRIKLKLRNWRGLSVDFLSQELTIEPERRVLSESLSEYKERKTGFSARDELFQLFRESLLEETEEEATLKLNELENRLQKTDEYERGYFLQRVVRILHNFIGIDKCPELQKKRAQYEEELGLQWIQY